MDRTRKTPSLTSRRTLKVPPAALSWAPRPPSIRRSIGRYRNSMYTVCGQAQPHQTRPYTAVSKTIPRKMPTRRSMSSMVSVGRKVAPKRVNSRRTMSSRMTGLPFILRYGISVNTPISAHASAWRRRQKRPGESLGRSQRRVPSRFSVGSTRSRASAGSDVTGVIAAPSPGRRLGFGRPLALAVHALRRLRVRRVGAGEREHVGGHGGELLRLELVLPENHALLGHALADRVQDLRRPSAAEPVVVGEVGADETLTLGAVAGQTAGGEDLLGRGHRARILPEGDDRLVGRAGGRELGLPRRRGADIGLVLGDDGRPRAKLVVQPVAARENDRGPENPHPPPRQRVVELLDPVVLVGEQPVAVVATHGSVSSGAGPVRPPRSSSSGRKRARSKAARLRRRNTVTTTVANAADARTNAASANRWSRMALMTSVRLIVRVSVRWRAPTATASVAFLMSAPRRWR